MIQHFDYLKRWIHTKHLDKTTVEGYCNAFAEHPARLLVLDSFLRPEVAQKISVCLNTEAIYKKIYGLHVFTDGTHQVSEETFKRASENERFFRFGQFSKIDPAFEKSENAEVFNEFRWELESYRMQTFFSAISGIPLGPGTEVTLHEMVVGDFLKPHGDTNLNRRLAFVIYVSPAWEPCFGGGLHIRAHDDIVTQVESHFNRLIIFDVAAHKLHHVDPIQQAAGDVRRLTIGGWFKNKIK